MNKNDKSRRKRLGVVNLQVDLYPSDKAWLSNQRKSRNLTWRKYFSQLANELRGLYTENRNLKKDHQEEMDNKNLEIMMLEEKHQQKLQELRARL